MGIFLGDFKDEKDIYQQFVVDKKDQEGVYILLACYACEAYEGSAFVLFMKDDRKLYEVNGSHCSCYGLEGQWEPEETSVKALQYRMDGRWYMYHMEKELNHALNRILNLMPILQAEE